MSHAPSIRMVEPRCHRRAIFVQNYESRKDYQEPLFFHFKTVKINRVTQFKNFYFALFLLFYFAIWSASKNVYIYKNSWKSPNLQTFKKLISEHITSKKEFLKPFLNSWVRWGYVTKFWIIQYTHWRCSDLKAVLIYILIFIFPGSKFLTLLLILEQRNNLL